MRQDASANAARPWVVQWLLVGVLALCVVVMHTPLGSHHAFAAKAPTSHSANGFSSTSAGPTTAADHGIKLTADISHGIHGIGMGQAAHGQQGDNCSCCPPLAMAARCAEVTSGAPQHGTPPQTPHEDVSAALSLVPPGSAAQRAAPPSLAELSLLRI